MPPQMGMKANIEAYQTILSIELIYVLILIVAALLIYFKTKEICDLTNHKGIQYFRNSFLLFTFSLALRFVMRLDLIFGGWRHRPDPSFFALFFIYGVLGYLALLYLMASLFWRQLSKYNLDHPIIFVLIAAIVNIIAIIFGAPYLFIIFLVLTLIIFIISIILKKRKNLKLHKGIYTLYFSLFLLWIINSFSQIIIQISPVLMGVFYVIHAGLFLIILYLISKKIKNGKKER